MPLRSKLSAILVSARSRSPVPMHTPSTAPAEAQLSASSVPPAPSASTDSKAHTFPLLKLPPELFRLILDHCSLPTLRALSLVSRALYEIVEPSCDSTRDFTRIEFPPSTPLCASVLHRLQHGLEDAGIFGSESVGERGGGGGGKVEKLLISMRGFPERNEAGGVAVMGYGSRPRAEVKCTGHVHSTETWSEMIARLQGVLCSLKELRILLSLDELGAPGTEPVKSGDAAVQNVGLWVLLGSLMELLGDILPIKTQHRPMRSVKVQFAVVGSNGRVRVVAADPMLRDSYDTLGQSNGFQYFYKAVTNLKFARDRKNYLVLPDAVLPESCESCEHCKEDQAGRVTPVSLQKITVINRPGRESSPTSNNANNNLQNSASIPTISRAIFARKKKSDPDNLWDQYFPIHFALFQRSTHKLSSLHFEGVTLITQTLSNNPAGDFNFLTTLCPHVGRLVLRNCGIEGVRWQEVFFDAAVEGVRLEKCELEELRDRDAVYAGSSNSPLAGNASGRLKRWWRWMVKGPNEVDDPSVMLLVNANLKSKQLMVS